jgi:hypothetical protein
MLIAIWNMLTNGVFYEDLGANFYSRRNLNLPQSRGGMDYEE